MDIEGSTDGSTWTPLFSGSSSGMTVELETYAFPPFEVRYLRIIGHGNAANLWNSITEIEISLARVTASDFQAPNVPENVLDSDLNTRWSALRKG